MDSKGRASGVLDRPLTRGRAEVVLAGRMGWAYGVSTDAVCMGVQVNLASFAFLFSEIIQYSHDRVQSIPDLEKKYARGCVCLLTLCMRLCAR